MLLFILRKLIAGSLLVQITLFPKLVSEDYQDILCSFASKLISKLFQIGPCMWASWPLLTEKKKMAMSQLKTKEFIYFGARFIPKKIMIKKK